jgi:hypothetical protein
LAKRIPTFLELCLTLVCKNYSLFSKYWVTRYMKKCYVLLLKSQNYMIMDMTHRYENVPGM